MRTARTAARRLLQPEIAVTLVAVVAAVAVSYRHGKDVNFDQLNAHITFASKALDGHLSERPPIAGGYGSFLPFYWDLPWWVLANRVPDYVAMLALVALAVPAIVATVRLGRSVLRGFGPWGGPILALALGLSSTSARTELGTTFGNLVTAGLFLLGFSLLLDHLGPDQVVPDDLRLADAVPRSAQRWAGALFGLSVGLKWTNAVFVFAVLVALLSARVAWQCVLRVALWSGGVLAVTSLPWGISSWSAYRNPVYPFYNGIFGSRFYDATSGGDDRWPMTLREVVSLPWKLAGGTSATGEVPTRDPRLLVTIAALILLGVLAAARRRASMRTIDPVLRIVVVTLAVSFPLWGVLFGVQRYFIVGEVLAGLVIGRVLLLALDATTGAREDGLPRTFAAGAAAAIVAIAMSASARPANFGHVPFTGKRWISAAGFARPDTDLVVLDDDRIAYASVFFPRDTAMFNLSPVARPHFKLTELLVSRLRSARQPIIVLREARQDSVAVVLTRLGAQIDPSTSAPLPTNIEVLRWCRLTLAGS